MNLKNWIQKPSPKSMKITHIGFRPSGWYGELDRCYVDLSNTYVVMIRTIDTEWGKVEHAVIRNVGSTDIPWAEKQRIKNELFGEDRVAIEVFPTEDELVDAAMMYHMWVLPEGFKMPFTIKS